MDEWEAEFDADTSDDGFVASFVRTSHLGGAGQEERAAETGLLAAIAAEPAVLAAVRDRYATWQDRVEREGSDPVEATVARLAADGLWLADLLGLALPRGAEAGGGGGFPPRGGGGGRAGSRRSLARRPARAGPAPGAVARAGPGQAARARPTRLTRQSTR